MNTAFHRMLLPLALICHLIVAWFSEGFYHDDEHYQVIEFANFKNGGTGAEDLPWEFTYKMRPALQPLMAWTVINLAQLTGIENPFDQALILRVLSALLSVFAIWLFLKNWKDTLKLPDSAIIFSYLLWTSIFVNVRFSSENWSSTLFFIGLAVYMGENRHKCRLFLSGLLMGLSFVLRYQSAVFIAAFLLWLLIIDRKGFMACIKIIGGCAVALIIGAAADTWFYRELVFPPWNYFKWNILEGKASDFGIEPFWFYFSEVFLKTIPPFSLLIITAFLYFWYKFPKNILTWISLSFVIVHSLIGHKELRFLFPLTFIIPIILSVSFNTFLSEQKSLNHYLQNAKLIRRTRKTLLALNILALVVLCIDIPKKQVWLYRYLYEEQSGLSKVYFAEINPYEEENPMVFYRRPGLEVQKLNKPDSLLVLDKSSFFLCSERDISADLLKSGLQHQLMFQSIPAWLTWFNFGNWQSRSRIWRVYKIEN